MAEKLVLEKEICAKCGADVRPQALFCYNCGAAVAPETAAAESDGKNRQISSAWFQNDLAEGAKTTNLAENDVPILKPTDEPIAKPSEELIEAPPIDDGQTPKQFEKLKTAASMRQKTRVKTISKKPVEIVWEEPATAPNVWFIIAAVLITLVAVGVLMAMLWIK